MADQEGTVTRVLIVDDNVELARRTSLYLTHVGYQVSVAHSGAEGLVAAYELQPDIIVLDIMMEGMDGWEVCRRLRENSTIPILFATAMGEEVNVVRGLDMGADGYIAKTFALDELEARIAATLRRARGEESREGPARAARSDGRITIDFDRNIVLLEGDPVAMSPKEYQVLASLVQAEGRLVRYDDLLASIWGEAYRDDTMYLAVYVSRLREKIERDRHQPEYIITRHRLGYEFQWPNGCVSA